MKPVMKVKRMVYAWTLFLALLPLSFVKTFHIHFCDSVWLDLQSDTVIKGEAKDCPICQFNLSPFVEASPVVVSYTVQEYALLPKECPIELPAVCMPLPVLRAPPFEI